MRPFWQMNQTFKQMFSSPILLPPHGSFLRGKTPPRFKSLLQPSVLTNVFPLPPLGGCSLRSLRLPPPPRLILHQQTPAKCSNQPTKPSFHVKSSTMQWTNTMPSNRLPVRFRGITLVTIKTIKRILIVISHHQSITMLLGKYRSTGNM